MRMWRNGETAEIVQKIIEYNFKLLGRHLPNNILALPTTQRETLSSDYLCEGLIVYDTTLNKWFRYTSNSWEEYTIDNDTSGESAVYTKTFTAADWENKEIYISYSTDLISNPSVGLAILDNGVYSPVIGGVIMDRNDNIILTTDLPFDGKVVIK